MPEADLELLQNCRSGVSLETSEFAAEHTDPLVEENKRLRARIAELEAALNDLR